MMKRFVSVLCIGLTLCSPCWGIERNVASQTIELMVLENGVPKTGDAANLTAYVSIDGDATEDALGDTGATEVDATNLPGLYRWDLTQAETNGAKITYGGKSSTADCFVVPVTVATVPAGFSQINVTNLNTLSGHDPGETIMGGTDLGTGSGLTSLATAAQATAIEADTQDLQSRTPASLTSRGFMKTDAFIVELTVTSVPNQTQPICSAGTTTAANLHLYAEAVITDVTNGETCTRDVLSWDNSGGQLTLDAATPFTLAAGDKIILRATSHKTAVVLPQNQAPGAANGLTIAGSNATTTFDSMVLTNGMVGNIIGTISGLRAFTLASGTVGGTGNDTTHVHLNGIGTYGNDELTDYTLVLYDTSASEYHSTYLDDFADTGDLATVATLPFTPVNTDLWWVLPMKRGASGGGLDAAGVRSAIGLAAANLDDQFGEVIADTEDIQSTLDGAPEVALNEDGQVELAPDQSQVTALGGVNTTGASVRAVDGSGNAIMPAASYTAPDNSTIGTINNKLGSITGSGTNTVLGYFRAMMAKASGLTPTDISSGTTYNNVTDSNEGNRDNVGTSGAGLTEVTGGGGGSITIPVNQVPVPLSRTWSIVRTASTGLKGKLPLSTTESASSNLWAIDFAVDLPTNGRLTDINSVEVISGEEAGLTLGEDTEDADDYGVDKALAKLRITPTTAGTYVLRVSVDYASADGGGSAVADVTLKVAE